MTYPTIAEINAADSAQLFSWRRTLPPPQTDVERTAWSRITRAIERLGMEETFAERFDRTFKEVFGGR